MKVRYTEAATRDLDDILTFMAHYYPAVAGRFESRLDAALQRIAAWPESAPQVVERPGIRIVPLVPYPYRLFYRVTAPWVEILHIHHAARRPPWEKE